MSGQFNNAPEGRGTGGPNGNNPSKQYPELTAPNPYGGGRGAAVKNFTAQYPTPAAGYPYGGGGAADNNTQAYMPPAAGYPYGVGGAADNNTTAYPPPAAGYPYGGEGAAGNNIAYPPPAAGYPYGVGGTASNNIAYPPPVAGYPYGVGGAVGGSAYHYQARETVGSYVALANAPPVQTPLKVNSMAQGSSLVHGGNRPWNPSKAGAGRQAGGNNFASPGRVLRDPKHSGSFIQRLNNPRGIQPLMKGGPMSPLMGASPVAPSMAVSPNSPRPEDCSFCNRKKCKVICSLCKWEHKCLRVKTQCKHHPNSVYAQDLEKCCNCLKSEGLMEIPTNDVSNGGTPEPMPRNETNMPLANANNPDTYVNANGLADASRHSSVEIKKKAISSTSGRGYEQTNNNNIAMINENLEKLQVNKVNQEDVCVQPEVTPVQETRVEAMEKNTYDVVDAASSSAPKSEDFKGAAMSVADIKNSINNLAMMVNGNAQLENEDVSARGNRNRRISLTEQDPVPTAEEAPVKDQYTMKASDDVEWIIVCEGCGTFRMLKEKPTCMPICDNENCYHVGFKFFNKETEEVPLPF